MDSFERAHVPRKSDKLQNKTKTTKAQYKQMLRAFKKGDNEGIRSSSEIKPNWDFDESFNSSYATSDNPEFTFTTETENESNSVLKTSNIDEDNSLICLPLGASSSVEIVTPSNFLSNQSAELEESDFSDSKSLSECSKKSIENDSENEQFDAEGILASTIKKNLNLNLIKISEEELLRNHNLKCELNKQERCIQTIGKPKEKVKDYFLSEEYYGDNGSWKEVIKDMNESKKEAHIKKRKKQSNVRNDPFDFSNGNNTLKLLKSSKKIPSPAFVSVCVNETASFNTKLSELVGQYVHRTTRDLEEFNSVSYTTLSDVFPANMCDRDIDNVTVTLDKGSDEELDSLKPEVDEDLTLEDLNIEDVSQELTQNIQHGTALNNTVSMDLDLSTLSSLEVPAAAEYVQMKLYPGKDNFILVMRHPSELFIHGKVQVSDFNRSSEILGYKLDYDPIEVFAPYSHYAQCLKTNNNHDPVDSELYNMLTAAGLTERDAAEILSCYVDDNTAIVQLSTFDSPKLDFVTSNFSPLDLFSRRGEHIPQFLKKAAESLGCSLYLTPPKKSFEEKQIWDEVYSSIICRKEHSRGIICGGKSMGKSTFLRHYVNTMIADGPILVLDLDPGQAEFSMPGNVSVTVVEKPLIGPSFTHLGTPKLMLNIGIINPMDNSKRYLSAVAELIAYCRANLSLQELPWIINTMGLCNNMGLKFMTYIILLIQPTFLFQIDSKMPKKSFGFELDPITVTQLYEKNANSPLFKEIQNPFCLHYSFIISRPDATPQVGNGSASNLLPRDERYLNILAYFGELFHQYTVDSLLDIIPFEVKTKDLYFGLNVKIPENTLAQVVNGKIVALCQQHQPDKWMFTLGNNALKCFGHGLIRNIDYEQGILYILTPVPFMDLSSVNTLVYSDWMPELRGLEKSPLPNGTTIPYRTSSTEYHQRKFMFSPRRRFNPLQLVKMSRNT